MAYSNYSHPGAFIAIPPTTDLAIVFPYDRSSHKFDRSFYSPALTDGRVSTEQIESFLKGAERIMKKKSRRICLVSCLFAFLALAGFLGIFCLAADPDAFIYNDDDLDDFFTYILGYFGFVIFGGVLLQLFIRRKQRKAKKGVKNHIKKNAQAFAVHGVRWNTPLYFPQWIELWKDYKGQGQGQVTYVQSPQVIQGGNAGYVIPQPVVQAVQYQPVMQNNVNSHAVVVPKYQGNNGSDKSMAQPLLSHQQHIEMGAYHAPSGSGNMSNL